MSGPPKSAGRRARRRLAAALRVLLLGVLLIAAAAAGLLSWLRSEAGTDVLRRIAVDQASQLSGFDLALGELEILGLSPLRLRLSDLTVHGRDAARPGQPLASIESADVLLGEWSRFRDRTIAIDAITVRRPAVRLALEDGELRDLKSTLDALKQGPPSPSKNKSKLELELGTVVVEDAFVVLSVDPGDVAVDFDGIDFGLRLDARGNGSGDLAIGDIQVIYGQIRERAALRPGTFTVQAGVLTLDGYAIDLRTGPVTLAGIVELPQSDRPEPGYSLSATAAVDLALLREAWPTLPQLEGDLDATVAVRGSGLDPQASFHIQGQDVLVHMEGPKSKVMKAGNPSLIGRYNDGRITLEEESAIAWGGGTVRPTGWLDLKGDLPFEVHADLRGIALERAFDSLTVPHAWVQMDMTGVADLRGQIKGGLQATGSAAIAARDFRVQGGPWDSPEEFKEYLRVPSASVEAQITLDSRHCLLEPAVVRGPNSALDVSVDFFFLRPLGLHIEVRGDQFAAADIERNVAGIDMDGTGTIEAVITGPSNDLDIAGSLELDDFVLRGWPFGRVGGDVHWHARENLEFTRLTGHRGESDYEAEVRLLFANTKHGGDREQAELSIDASVPEGHGRAEDLLPIFFGNDLGARGPAWGQASFYGPPNRLTGVGRLSGRDLDYLWERFDTLDATVHLVEGDFVIEEAFARKASGNALFARGTIRRGGGLDFEFRLPDMGLEEFAPIANISPLIKGRVAGGAVLSGTLKNVLLDADVAISDLTYRGAELGDTALRFDLVDHVLAVSGGLLDEQIRAEAELVMQGLWAYSFGLDWRDLSLDPVLPHRVLAHVEPVSAGTSGRFTGAGTLRDSWHDVVLRMDELFLERGVHRVEAAAGSPVVLRYDDGAFRFDQVQLKGPEGRTDLLIDGWVRPSGPLHVTLDGVVDVAFIDLVSDVFDRAEARSLLVDLELTGMSTSSLDVNGTAELRDAFVRTVYFPHFVEVDYARVSLQNRRLTVEDFTGSMGGGRLENVAGSTILLDRTGYRPRTYDLRVHCVDCTIRYPSFMPPATATAELRFEGTAPNELVLRGDVHVKEMVLRDPLNWQRSVLTFVERSTQNLAQETGSGLFRLDLAFTSDDGVLRMSNNIGDIRGTAQNFRVVGDTARIELKGSVRIDGGTLPYKGQPFTIEPGFATFRGGSSWFPDLSLRMWTDIESRDESYRITYQVTGPLNSPQLVPSSDPQLAESDINLLMLIGLTQDQLAEAELTELLPNLGAATLGTYGETVGTSAGQQFDQKRNPAPDRIEIVPVYTDTTGATTLWAVATKEVVPDLVTIEGGVGLFAARTDVVSTVFRAQLKLARNFYLEGSWLRDDNATQPYGNFGLDIKLELEAD